jgi:hypothetical protein
MASFGSFETEREVYSDPIYTVYSARKAGDPKSEYAVKVFSIQRAGFDPQTTNDLAPLLVDIEDARSNCLEMQAKGAAQSAFIAPVFEQGRDDRGVWYATRFYPRSVNKIIVGNVALTREALFHVLKSAAQGALDLKRACGRSHGEIRPSCIQLSRSERLTKAEVVICDPIPGGPEETQNFELNDLHSIGRILLQLVQQRGIGKDEDFLILPILSSDEWTRLFGKDTEKWLSLCNRLLDSNLSLEQFTLERLVAELDQLEPKAKVSPKLLIGIAAGLLGLGVLAVWWVFIRPKPKIAPVHGQNLEVDQTAKTIALEMKVDSRWQLAKARLDAKADKPGVVGVSTKFGGTNWQMVLTPQAAGNTKVRIVATDEGGFKSLPTSFEVNVKAKPLAPTLAPVNNQVLEVGQPKTIPLEIKVDSRWRLAKAQLDAKADQSEASACVQNSSGEIGSWS